MTLAIDVEGLSKRFGNLQAVDNVSLQILRNHGGIEVSVSHLSAQNGSA